MKISEENNSHIPAITIIGVGGRGGRQLYRILDLVKLVYFDIDRRHLLRAAGSITDRIGIIDGRSGNTPEVGRQVALEYIGQIEDSLRGSDALFIVAGLGGGTGTGAAPVIAETASLMDIPVYSHITLPFKAEGKDRMKIADKGIKSLGRYSDFLTVSSPDVIFSDICSDKDSQLDAKLWVDAVTAGYLHKDIEKLLMKDFH